MAMDHKCSLEIEMELPQKLYEKLFSGNQYVCVLTYIIVFAGIAEGFWSLLRSWLRPHRGISQEKLPKYLGFFQFVHNVRLRGKGLLAPLLEALVA